MAGVVGLLGSREDVVKLDVTGARSQHQETLAGRKGTTGEAAIASVALVENGHGAKPQRRKTKGNKVKEKRIKLGLE